MLDYKYFCFNQYKESKMTLLKRIGKITLAVAVVMLSAFSKAQASEIDLNIPMLDVSYNIWGYATTGSQLLFYGMGI